MKSRIRTMLEVLSSACKKAEEEAITVQGITPLLAAVMSAVVQVGRRKGVGGVAELLSISQSHATESVQKLESLGLVHRVIRDGDKLHSILLTRKGSSALAQIDASERYVLESVLAPLPDEERGILIALLEKAAMGVV